MHAAKNPWVGVNYLDTNHAMAVPPAFWLQRLYDYDAELVLFPSASVPYGYVLARKARMSGLAGQALANTVTNPDTRFCLARKLVPVTLITQIGSIWNADPVIASLQARDIWAHGGGDAMADQFDAVDDKAKAKVKADIRDDMWNRSGDAWRSYQARTGQRTAYRAPAQAPRERGATAPTAPSGSTAGSGPLVTLT